MTSIHITVNGTTYDVDVENRLLLVHLIRDELGLTGTTVGCDTSNCGACTVLIDGRSAKSCTLFAVQADGSAVTTIEGMGTQNELHPLQRAFHREHGLQCGYCTPGMIMACASLLKTVEKPSESAIREGIEGNICRCTGYQNIVRAVASAAAEMSGGVR